MTSYQRCLVEVSPGGSYAPCSYYYRIVSEPLHRRAMRAVAANGGPVPEDPREDNVLFQTDDMSDIVPARHLKDLDDGYTVRFLLDRWEAFAYYGYDASEAS